MSDYTIHKTKLCNACHLDKPLSDFYKGRGRCKKCHYAQVKQLNSKRNTKVVIDKPYNNDKLITEDNNDKPITEKKCR